jgi:hypothetical protein
VQLADLKSVMIQVCVRFLKILFGYVVRGTCTVLIIISS